jgi:hypothetical protein
MVLELLILRDHLRVHRDTRMLLQLRNLVLQLLILNLIFPDLSFTLNHHAKVLSGPLKVSDGSAISLARVVVHLLHDDLYDFLVAHNLFLKLTIEGF